MLSYGFSHNIYVGLFHNKKCCNCINLFPCILWDLFVMSCIKLVKIAQKVDLATWFTSGATCEGHMRSTCWKLKSHRISRLISRLGQLVR